jgi:D-amino-acid dehydrogenase
MKPGVSMRYSVIWPHRAFMITPTAGGIRVGGNVELAGLDAAPDFRRRACWCAMRSARCPA